MQCDVFGLVESNSEHVDVKKEEDIRAVKGLAENRDLEIIVCFRIGKKKVENPGPRPLKVVFGSELDKHQFKISSRKGISG